MDELKVGATPKELIPGDVEAITRLSRRLQNIAVGCEDAANQLRGLQAGDWQGEAAEAFADALDQEPSKYVRAAEAFRDAALAVERYAAALEGAQHEAQRAVTLFEDAAARHARAEADAAGAATDAPVTIAPAETGTEDGDIVRARAMLEAAREGLEHEADIASRRLSEAAEAAPNKPGWGHRLLHGAGEFFGGVGDATWGTGKFLWSVSQVRMVVDPKGWFHDVKGIGQGLVWGVAHPVDFAKAIADWETWKENPARAAGRLVPDIALLLATAGAGAAGRGIRGTEKAADAAESLRAAERAADAAEDLRAAERVAEDLRATETAAERTADATRAESRASHQPARSSKMDDERRLRLQQDSDHGGGITENSVKEAEIAEDLESRGILEGVDRGNLPGQGDFFDSSGQNWDLKAPKSRESLERSINAELRRKGLPERTFDPNRPIKGEFSPRNLIPDMKKVIDKGRKIVLDSRDLNESDLRVLREAIEQEGLGDQFIWYP